MTEKSSKIKPIAYNNPLEIYSTRVAHEHELISQRMTWLMAVNGFLVAAYAVIISGSLGQRAPSAQATAIIGISALGALANASCFFSNYWASRALLEAAYALNKMSIDGLVPDGYRTYLRLYGGDPKTPLTSFSIWQPPSKILHPWHLLPLVFLAAFLAAPFMFRHLAASYVIPVVISAVPAILTTLLFAIPIAAEWRWRRRS